MMLKCACERGAAIVAAAVAVFVMNGCSSGDQGSVFDVFIPPIDGGTDIRNDSGADEGSADLPGDTVVADNGFDSHQIDAGTDVSVDHGNPDPDAVSDVGNDVGTDSGMDTNQSDSGPACWIGQEECYGRATGIPKTCETAQVLSRVFLATDKGVVLKNPETINESTGGNENDDELDKDGCPWFGEGDETWCKNECDDDGKDHFYMVYLVPGDYFSLSVSDYLVYQKEGININFMLKLYKGNQCKPTREALVQCINDKSSGSANIEVVQIKPVTEAEAGWYTIVVDSVGTDDAGTYSLEAHLFNNYEYQGDWSVCCDG